jgi:hypothetical protein
MKDPLVEFGLTPGMRTLYKLSQSSHLDQQVANYILDHAPAPLKSVLTNPNLVLPVIKAVSTYQQNKLFWDGLIGLARTLVGDFEPDLPGFQGGDGGGMDAGTAPSEPSN